MEYQIDPNGRGQKVHAQTQQRSLGSAPWAGSAMDWTDWQKIDSDRAENAPGGCLCNVVVGIHRVTRGSVGSILGQHNGGNQLEIATHSVLPVDTPRPSMPHLAPSCPVLHARSTHAARALAFFFPKTERLLACHSPSPALPKNGVASVGKWPVEACQSSQSSQSSPLSQ